MFWANCLDFLKKQTLPGRSPRNISVLALAVADIWLLLESTWENLPQRESPVGIHGCTHLMAKLEMTQEAHVKHMAALETGKTLFRLDIGL